MIALALPYPPSANSLWRQVNGRTLVSKRYRVWRAEAEWIARIAGRGARLRGHYELTLTAERPDRRRRDIDNLIKPCSDALKAGGLIEDDCLADRIVLAWMSREPVKTPALVHLTLTEVP